MTDKGAQKVALAIVGSTLMLLGGVVGYDQYKEWRAGVALERAVEAAREQHWQIVNDETDAYIAEAKRQLAEQGAE